MEEKDLIDVIDKLRKSGRESKMIDAKQELGLKDKEVGTKAEFVKDVAAMANNGEKSYLIIGLCDRTFNDFGKLTYHYVKNDLNQILKGKIDPPVVVDYQEFTINGNEYGLIEIIGHNPPYIIAQDLVSNKTDKKKIAIYKGTIFVRHEDSIVGISRSELEELLKAKGLKKVFDQETEYAQQLVFTRPLAWEYSLIAELLRSKLAPIKRKFEELQRGLVYKKSLPIPAKEVRNWMLSRIDDLSNLGTKVGIIINEEISKAVGAPGVEGDPLEIKRVVEELISICYELVEWEKDVHYAIFPRLVQSLKSTMEGWTTQFMDEISNMSEQVDKLAELCKQDPIGKHTVELVFHVFPGLEEFTAEVNHLQEKYPEELGRLFQEF